MRMTAPMSRVCMHWPSDEDLEGEEYDYDPED